VTTDVQHESAPWKAGQVFDGDRVDGESMRSGVHELQKGLQAVEDAERIWRGEDGSGGRDFEVVGLIFAKLLDGRAWAGCLDQERRVISGLGGYRKDSGFGGEVGEEAVASAFEARLGVAFESHLKAAVEGEAS
jgi:hypothetical protein